MPLGKEVGLGPGHIVLDGDQVGTQRPTAAPPHFRPMSIVAKRSPISATPQLLYLLSLKYLLLFRKCRSVTLITTTIQNSTQFNVTQ